MLENTGSGGELEDRLCTLVAQGRANVERRFRTAMAEPPDRYGGTELSGTLGRKVLKSWLAVIDAEILAHLQRGMR